MKDAIEPDAIELRQTCEACPEQYDAYLGDNCIGYLRLRHGCFRVDCGDETVFLAYPSGDGQFEDGERASYLRKSQIAIAAKMNEERPK